MLGLDTLLVPLLTALAVFGTVVVLDSRTVFIRSMDVPPMVKYAGYDPYVIEDKISSKMIDIEQQAFARKSTRKLELEDGDSSIDLIAEYFDLTPLVRAFQQSGGFIAYVVEGYITKAGDENQLKLQITARDGTETDVTVAAPKDKLDALMDDAAYAVLKVVEPEVVCAAKFQAAIRTKTALDEVEACIHDSMPEADASSRIWLTNLAGVVRFVQGDQDGAMEAFKRVLKWSPNFSPALINVGVLFALNGNYQDAVRAYESIFADLNDGVSTAPTPPATSPGRRPWPPSGGARRRSPPWSRRSGPTTPTPKATACWPISRTIRPVPKRCASGPTRSPATTTSSTPKISSGPCSKPVSPASIPPERRSRSSEKVP